MLAAAGQRQAGSMQTGIGMGPLPQPATLTPTLGGGLPMKANVGDRLITEGVDGGQRECLIIQLQHEDGSPPYVVRWLSDGHIALVFPGPYTRLVHRGTHRGHETGPKR
jgi:Domain of unknown function (DUF1918)